MRIVVDTNVSVSGLLWGGPPNQILKGAREGRLVIMACEQITAELKRVFRYPRFSKRLSDLHVSAEEVFSYYMNMVCLVSDVKKIPKTVTEDQFDNIFLALAEKHHAKLIVSGDRHLLEQMSYHSIQIVTPSEAVQVLEKLRKEK